MVEIFGKFGWKDSSGFNLSSIRGLERLKILKGRHNIWPNTACPIPTYFLFGAIFLELVGSITVILGYFTRFGALLLLIFLIPTTIIFHTNFDDPIQMIMFMKNVSMFGGCFILLGMGQDDSVWIIFLEIERRRNEFRTLD